MTAFELLRTLVLAALAVGAQRMREFDLIMERLDAIETKVNRLLGMGLGDARRDNVMADTLEELRSAVAMQKDATQSAVTLIQGLAEQLEEAVGDDTEVERLAGELRATAQSLADAVTENTQFSPSGNT
jgi:hypothetical protein